MGLFDGGKSEEEKNLEKIARALDEMRLKDADGMVHAGCFKIGLMSDVKDMSLILDGVLEFLQKNGREIIDVKPGLTSGSEGGNATFTVLYR